MQKWDKEIDQATLNNEKEVLELLKKNYQDALDEINDKIAILLGRQDADMRHVIYQVEYQEALKTQIEGILDMLQANEFETISEYLTKSYEEGYMGAMYSMQMQGVPLILPIDQEQVVKAIQNETKLSEDLYTSLGKDIKTLNKQIAGEISRGISTGKMYSEIAKDINGYARIGRNNAMRIARTEGHRIQSQANYDAQVKAKSKGADVVKIWSSALDAKTRDSHFKLDGQKKEVDEPFKYGRYTAMFPGEFGVAHLDINCRCRAISKARWLLDEDSTKMLGDVSKMSDKQKKAIAKKLGIEPESLDEYSNQIVPVKAKNYADFKRQYDKLWHYEGSELQEKAEARIAELEKAKKDKKEKPSVIIEFTPAKSIKEAEEYITKYVDSNVWGGTGISYKGISVESANAVNETLNELYSTFNIDKLGGVYVAKGNTKLGKLIENATAGYSPVRQSLLLNNRAMKDLDEVAKGKAEELRLINVYKNNPSGLVFRTKRAEDVMKASMLSGRGTVADDVRDVINHEMGHSIERIVSTHSNYATVKARMPKYAEKISGYATINEAEYIAESFASYRKGENLIDPELAKIFDSLKQQPTGVEKAVKSATITTHPLNYFSTKDIETVRLPKDEYAHFMREVNTHMSDEQRAMPVVSKAIGDYIYTFENHGFNEYRIIDRKLIEGDKYEEIERIHSE